MSSCQRLDIQQMGDAVGVRFGEIRVLDGWTTEELKGEFSAAADREECRRLVVDFSGVTYLSSTMLQELVMLRRRMQSKGGLLTLVHVGSNVREILVVTGLDQVFDIVK